jgi:DNA replicative helicase MCM subunit Mcm2 (Cdc46/Mcm family)
LELKCDILVSNFDFKCNLYCYTLAEIRQLSRDPRICQRIAKSMAPSIHGHDDIKTAGAVQGKSSSHP